LGVATTFRHLVLTIWGIPQQPQEKLTQRANPNCCAESSPHSLSRYARGNIVLASLSYQASPSSFKHPRSFVTSLGTSLRMASQEAHNQINQRCLLKVRPPLIRRRSVFFGTTGPTIVFSFCSSRIYPMSPSHSIALLCRSSSSLSLRWLVTNNAPSLIGAPWPSASNGLARATPLRPPPSYAWLTGEQSVVLTITWC
jgi:hypothetical protein